LISKIFFYFSNFRDPMDAVLLEHHLRSPLRLFPDPIMAQFMQQDPEGVSAVLLEKTKQHLQMWGRSPYTELLLPQVYQRHNIAGINLGLWQGQWSRPMPNGFLSNSSTPQTPPPSTLEPVSTGSPSPDTRVKHFQRFSPYQVPPNHPQTSRSPQK
jgi:T-box protein 20